MATPARIAARIRRLRARGYTLEGIACAMGLEVEDVRAALRAAKPRPPRKVERARKRAAWPEQTRAAAIAELLAEGRDPAVIAAVFGDAEP